jgi:hypothetical protein
MKFCFFKRLASALEETMSVARPHLGKPEILLIGASRSRKSSPAVDGATNSVVLRRVEYRQGTRHADVDTVEDGDGVIVTESLAASSELYYLCMSQYIV